MEVPFVRAGKLSNEAYRRRRDSTTAQQLGALLASPAFATWQESKTRRELNRKTTSNALLATACVALLVALALLRPSAAPAPHKVPADVSNERLTARLRAAALESSVGPSMATAMSTDQHSSNSSQEEQEELQLQLQVLSHELEVTKEELASALDRTSELGLALAASQEPAAPHSDDPFSPAEQPEASTPSVAEPLPLPLPLPPRVARVAPGMCPWPARAPLLTAPPSVDNTTLTFGYSFDHSSLSAAATIEETLPLAVTIHPPGATALSTALPFVALAAVAGALCAAATAYAWYARRVAWAEQRSQELKARLNEAAFARDTAEQSLNLLEAELQRKLAQLEEAQRAASAAGSPGMPTPLSLAGGLTPAPPGAGALTPPPPGTGRVMLTPCTSALPPPPAHLVERFLRERNAVAVDQEQVTAWLEMEEAYGELQEALAGAQAAAADKEAALASLSSARDEQLVQVRAWLEQAQDQLLTTQAALQEREAECRALSERVAELAARSGEGGSASADRAALLQHNLQLAAQLQRAASEQENLAQLSATGYELAREVSTSGRQDAGAVAGTPGDLARDVNSVLELMRATRASLADRLAHSQQACESMIQELQSNGARLAVAAAAGASDEQGEQAQLAMAEEEQEAEASRAVEVLGASSRFNTSHVAVPASKLPQGQEPDRGEDGVSPAPPVKEAEWLGESVTEETEEGEDDAAAARAWVRQLHASCAPFDLAGFLTALGCNFDEDGEEQQVSQPVSPCEWADLKARGLAVLEGMGASRAADERAAAAEASRLLAAWQWPVGRVATPPPSPWWAKLGLKA